MAHIYIVAIIVGCLGSYRALFVINRNPVRYYHDGTRSSGKSRSKLSTPGRSKDLYPIYSTTAGDSSEFASPVDERNNHFAMNPLPQSDYRNYTEIRVAYPEPALDSRTSFRR